MFTYLHQEYQPANLGQTAEHSQEHGLKSYLI